MRLFIGFLLFCTLTVHAQEKPFKTGLVLSGGGAKGAAHTGLLQLIDSLEIQVDYITGTSMGSIVGAMYSLGYSGDSITNILSNIDWKYLLSNDIPMQRIHINEKDENRNMIIGLPVEKIRPKLPKFVIDGQYLSEMLCNYLFSARNISNFHQLPIPFECIATDIVTGESVILKEGSLATAVRASMAIPAFFSPVYINDHTLIDGGLTRNFPVEEAKSMGAEVVIGSYTGFRKLAEEEISDITNTIIQLFALSAVEDAKKQMQHVDVLLDLTDAMKKFGSQSFGNYKEIIEIGKTEARKLLPQLIELKKRQQAAGIEYKRHIIQPRHMTIKDITVSDIYGNPFSAQKQDAVLAIIDKDDKQKLDSLPYLNKKIDQLFSHQFYNKVQYSFTPNEDGTKNLNLFLSSTDPTLQIAVHYDTYESAGIVLRYKKNNFWLDNSRLMIEADLSQYGKNRISYLKYLNWKMNTWVRLEYYDHKQKYHNLNFRKISELNHFTVTSLHYIRQSGKLTAGYSPTINSSISASFEVVSNMLEKNSGMLPSIFYRQDSTSGLLYNHEFINTFFTYNHNSLNSDLFPISGNKLNLSLGFLFNNSFSLTQPHDGDLIGREYHQLLNPANYSTNNYNSPVLQFSIHEYKVIPLSSRVSLHGRLFYGLNFRKRENTFSLVKNSEYMVLSNKFNLGGYSNYRYEGQIPFAGLRVKEFSTNNLAAVSLSLQWRVWKKLYITPAISVATGMDHINPFHADNKKYTILGAGLSFDYLTPIGPIKLSYSINSEKIPHSFLSLGYQF
ncbi:MAG: patatin-like phospholipase family protein [Bacteroidia bacterium]|nr:patatin-like phospholipase family protein [Bacteroidia bacterium]